MKFILLCLFLASVVFMLGLKVTGESPVSRKIPVEQSKETMKEKWENAVEWSKNRKQK